MGLWIQPSYNRISDIDDDDLNEIEMNLDKIAIIAETYQIEISIETYNDYQNKALALIDKSQSTESMGIYSGEVFNLPLFKENEMFFSRTEEFLEKLGEVYPFIKELVFTEPGVRIFVFS